MERNLWSAPAISILYLDQVVALRKTLWLKHVMALLWKVLFDFFDLHL